MIDTKLLADILPKEFDAIIVLHTWEYGKPPIKVKRFIKQNEAVKNKIVVLTTSGEGSFKMDGVDALTGESNLKDAEEYSDKIIRKVEALLAKNPKLKI